MNSVIRKILYIILLFSSYTVFAQNEDFIIKVDTIYTHKSRIIKIVKVRTIPKFILQLSASYNSGAMELSAHNGGFSQEDFTVGKSFCARHGFGVNLTGKLPLSKKGNLWLDFIAGFDHFQSNLFASNTEEGKVYYNVISGGTGIEYVFTPPDKMKYFVGINPLFSVISGKASGLINPDNNRINVTIKSSVRIGYSAFMGLAYAFDKNFGVNAELKFTHANLFMKNSEDGVQETGVNSIIPLNDDAVENIQFAGWKQFAYFSSSVGLSYFFGVKERKYRVPD